MAGYVKGSRAYLDKLEKDILWSAIELLELAGPDGTRHFNTIAKRLKDLDAEYASKAVDHNI